jgi:hypothetical protein
VAFHFPVVVSRPRRVAQVASASAAFLIAADGATGRWFKTLPKEDDHGGRTPFTAQVQPAQPWTHSIPARRRAPRVVPSAGNAAAVLASSAGLAGCGGGGGGSGSAVAPGGSASIDGAAVFPGTVALGSPVPMADGVISLAGASTLQRLRGIAMASRAASDRGRAPDRMRLAAHLRGARRDPLTPAYLKSANAINELLTGAADAQQRCSLRSRRVPRGRMATRPATAPRCSTKGHPERRPWTSGTLPSGDVGLWSVLESKAGSDANGWACSSAQLDARMDSGRRTGEHGPHERWPA